MKKIFGLRITLPLLIALFAITTLQLSLQSSRNALVNEITEKVSMESRDLMTLMQGAIEQLVRLNEEESIKQLVSAFASRGDLINIVVVDHKDIVIASNDYSHLGKGWRDINITPDLEYIERVTKSHSTEIRVDQTSALLDGYSGLCSGKRNVLRSTECGFIFYRIDLDYHYQTSLKTLYSVEIFNALGLMIGALLLIIVIHFLITRRIAMLSTIINQFSAGERNIRSHCWGQDEIRGLGDTINKVLDKINQNEAQILDREKRLDTLFEIIIDGIVVIDHKGTIQRINQAATGMFLYEEKELIGENVKLLMPQSVATNHDQYLDNYMQTGEAKIIGIGREVTAMRKDGSRFVADLSISEMRLNGVVQFVGVLRDVTQRKEMENIILEANEKLQHAATTDALTGLANRRHFDDILEKELNRATRENHTLALLLGDIDFFKRFNDHYGHVGGDVCLQKISHAISDTFQRAGELTARYGGEEFAVILPNTSELKVKQLSEKLLQAIRDLQIPHQKSDAAPYVTMSLGYTLYTPSDNKVPDSDQFIANADKGLYQAKELGRNQAQPGKQTVNQ